MYIIGFITQRKGSIMKLRKVSSILYITVVIALILSFTACSNSTYKSSDTAISTAPSNVTEVPIAGDTASIDSTSEYPISIRHAFGETILKSKPERIATISWGNQDVPLALGIIPVGVSKANYGVTDDSGLLPWTADKYKELGENTPLLFNDTDGLDYEAISDAQPDVILAAYSGITKEEYDLLSDIAPVVAYPKLAWQTFWRDQIIINATGIGMKSEGKKLVSDLEQLLMQKTSKYPQIKAKTAAFFYFNPADLGKFYIYLPRDPRAAFLTDLGMEFPESLLKLAKESESFALELSAENADLLADIDIIIAYGDNTLLKTLQTDSLIGTIPAIKRGSVVLIKDNTPLAASGTPSALSIPATIDTYLSLIGEAANKVK